MILARPESTLLIRGETFCRLVDGEAVVWWRAVVLIGGTAGLWSKAPVAPSRRAGDLRSGDTDRECRAGGAPRGADGRAPRATDQRDPQFRSVSEARILHMVSHHSRSLDVA